MDFNIKVFGNLGDLTARIFGANIFEQKRAQKEREASARGRVLQEENYDLNYLTYKFLTVGILIREFYSAESGEFVLSV